MEKGDGINTLWMHTVNQQSDMGVAVGAGARPVGGQGKCPDTRVNCTRQTSYRPMKHCPKETQRL